MTVTVRAVLRACAALAGVPLLAGGCVLAWIAAVALSRHEGVFLPAGYVSVACLLVAVLLLRYAGRRNRSKVGEEAEGS